MKGIPMPIRPALHRAGALVSALCLIGLATAAPAIASPTGQPVSSAPAAAGSAEEQLAARFSPIVVAREPDFVCGRGEQFTPVAVDAIFGRPDVTLRRADGTTKTAPVGADLGGLGEGNHLDLPGDPLRPRCDFSRWAASLDSAPTVYARVATDPTAPGELALQYWLFWVYNDWNDRHEGDWEMLQLNFDVATAAEALAVAPTSTILAQHEGGEVASWSDAKLNRDGDHVAVYPGQGSHASYYGQSVWFGKSAESGFGCDDTSVGSGITAQRLDPEVVMLVDQPWLTYTGRWGEKAPSFNNGPTGPNTKTQWETPIAWTHDEGRPDAVELPAAPGASVRMFCTLTTAGSMAYLYVLGSPILVGLAAIFLIGLLAWLAVGTRWRSVDPVALQQPRRVGEVLVSAAGVVRRHPRLFLPLAAVQLVVLGVLRLAVNWVNRVQPSTDLTDVTGRASGPLAWVVNLVLVLLVTGVIAVAATMATDRVHGLSGRSGAKPEATRRRRLVAGSALLLAQVWAVLVLWPAAIVLLSFWLLASPWTAAGGPVRDSLGASARLTRGRAPSTAGLTVGIVLVVALGPVVGTLILLGTSLPHYASWLVSAAVMGLATVWAGVALALALYSAEAERSRVAHTEQTASSSGD